MFFWSFFERLKKICPIIQQRIKFTIWLNRIINYLLIKTKKKSLLFSILSNRCLLSRNAFEFFIFMRLVFFPSGFRDKEMKYLKGRKYLDALCVYFWATTPVIISILTFATYVLIGNKLTAATVFTAMALLNMLISPLNAFPWVLNGMTEAWVSIRRIQRLIDVSLYLLNSPIRLFIITYVLVFLMSSEFFKRNWIKINMKWN